MWNPIYVFVLLVSITAASAASDEDSKHAQDVPHHREERAIMQLGLMVGCLNHKTQLEGLFWATYNYSSYGCYCGPGGSGEPVDEKDKCCQTHDKCYDDLVKDASCPGLNETTVIKTKYNYTQTGNCSASPSFTCDHTQNECLQRLCLCDTNITTCFAGTTYNKSYRFYTSLHKHDSACGHNSEKSGASKEALTLVSSLVCFLYAIMNFDF